MNECNCIVGQYSKERLVAAERVISRLITLAAQGNHTGKDPKCPYCQCLLEMRQYFEKWVSAEDIEQFKKDNAEIFELFKSDMKKAALLCQIN